MNGGFSLSTKAQETVAREARVFASRNQNLLDDADDLRQDALVDLYKYAPENADGGLIVYLARQSFLRSAKRRYNRPSVDFDLSSLEAEAPGVRMMSDVLLSLAPSNQIQKQIQDVIRDPEPYWHWALMRAKIKAACGGSGVLRTPSKRSLAEFLGVPYHELTRNVNALRVRIGEHL